MTVCSSLEGTTVVVVFSRESHSFPLSYVACPPNMSRSHFEWRSQNIKKNWASKL